MQGILHGVGCENHTHFKPMTSNGAISKFAMFCAKLRIQKYRMIFMVDAGMISGFL